MFIKTPRFLKRIMSNFIWDIPTNEDEEVEKSIYLTFDDGPTPNVTEWVLETLSNYNAKATFFCLGKNVELYPEIFKMIIEKGHAPGNHTYSHQKGWKMNTERYVEDVDLADGFIHSKLFRPPYGQITYSQSKRLSERYKFILWDLLSHDYNSSINPKKTLNRLIECSNNGSIIVFHDSMKSFKNLSYILPRLLEQLQNEGYKFKSIEL